MVTGLRKSAGWVLGHEEFELRVIACGGRPSNCDDEVERLVLAGQTIAGARALVLERLGRRADN